jgi:hypothetical protein
MVISQAERKNLWNWRHVTEVQEKNSPQPLKLFLVAHAKRSERRDKKNERRRGRQKRM